jgi:LysM repeat protein
LGRSDPVKDEIAARKRALKDVRRRRIGTPIGRQRADEIPPDAVVFQKSRPVPEGAVVVPAPPELPEGAVVFKRQPKAEPAQAENADLDTPPDFLRKTTEASAEPEVVGETAEPAVAAQEPDPEPEQKPAEDALGGDMMDIFREAKTEAAQGNLASEVEDISIKDLLGDLSGISTRLGVPKRVPAVHQVPVEAVIEVIPEPEGEPELKIEKVVSAPLAEPEPVVVEVVPEQEVDIDIGSLLTPEPEPEAPPPRAPVKPPVQQTPPERTRDRGMMMHVFLVGLALAAAGAFGLTRIPSPGSASGEQSSGSMSGIVLAVVTTPRPSYAAIGTKAPTPSPTPAPTAELVFPATPKPVKVKNPSIPPAFHDYQVEYGDSLTSISMGFGICPDHLLWANNRDEDTPLMAGEYLVIPDGVGVIHKVRNGDTLNSIARLYNSTVDAITGVPGNQLSTSDDLIVGDSIFVPDGIPQSALDMGSKAEKKMTQASSDGLVWPFYGPITTYYGEQRVGYVHNAIDIGGLGHYGAPVNAIADGIVVFVGNDSEYGQNVIVAHPDGSRSRYAHFSHVYVSQGDSVSQGQALGALGCSGDSTGTHLHFELWQDGKPVDPLLYLTPA